MLTRLEIEAIGGLLLVAALLLGLHFYNAHQQAIGALQCQAAVSKAQAAEHAKVVILNQRNDELAAQLVQVQASRKVTYATITRTVDRLVDRPVFRNTCIDPDGLRSINAALAGKADDPGVAASAVPAASAP